VKLIVGLGNPGRSYAKTRHNIGFICVSHFARKHHIRFNQKQSLARIGTGEIAGAEVVLARPQTFMNQSGRSVALLVERFGISPDELVVIHDDLDLEPGKIRLRKGSSSGGHKGVASIIEHLGSRDFIRLRVGVGRPGLPGGSSTPDEDEVVRYVLGNFTPEEKIVIARTLPRVSEALLCLLTLGLTAAMNKYN